MARAWRRRRARSGDVSFVVTYGSRLALVVAADEADARAAITDRYLNRRRVRLYPDEVRVRRAVETDARLVTDFRFDATEPQVSRWLQTLQR